MNIASTGQMRAQSISIQVSERTKCNGHCRYCISRTTPGQETRELNPKKCDFGRLEVGLNLAKTLGATHAIITGKADPTQEDLDYLIRLIEISREYVPLVDMHTNGLRLQNVKEENLKALVDAGLTMITFSVASFRDEINRNIMGIPQKPKELIELALRYELLVRCSLVVNKSGERDLPDILSYIAEAGSCGAHMVVIRELWVPEVYGDFNKGVYEWSRENQIRIGPIEKEFQKKITNKKGRFHLAERDPLPWGTPVYVMGDFPNNHAHGVNITFAKCDDASSGPVIKSIVHKPNGHGYRNWDHNGDILY